MFKPIGGFRHGSSLKPVLALGVMMAAAVVLGTAFFLFDLYVSQLEHAKGETVSLSRILSEQTTRAMDGVSLSMRGTRERLSDSLGQRLPLSSEPVHLLLRARIAGLPQVKSMFLVDERGLAVNSSRDDLGRPLDVSQRNFFLNLHHAPDDEVYISPPEKARLDDQWTFYVGIRLSHPDGRFRGLLVAAMNIEYFASLYDSIHLDFVDKIMLLGADGVVMAGSRAEPGSVIGQRDEAARGMAGDNARSGGELVVSTTDNHGEARFSTYRPVAQYPLIVVAAVKVSEALTPWRRVALPMLGGALAVIFFIGLATAFVLKSLLRRERLEQALKERDERLRHMVGTVRDAIVTVDAGHRVVLCNAAAESLFAVNGEAALGCDVAHSLLHNQPPVLAANLLRFLNEGCQSPPGLASFGMIALVREGEEIPVELSLSTTRYRGEIFVTAVLRDLSERRRSEAELLKSNRQLQELSASLQNVREEEQRRIALELHDELGQLLTALKMEVSWLGGRLVALQPEMDGKVAAVKNMIAGTIAAVRRISSELRPLVLDDLGLVAAINWYADQFAARTGLQVRLELPDSEPKTGSLTATALYRVMQESLTNVARHAGASSVVVRLASVDRGWRLTVADDGKGVGEHGGSGLGLVSMRERVQTLGGRFEIQSAPGQGTTVDALIPRAGEEDNA